MPEVTCPNCGLTINLENRREIDYGLIMDATKEAATFTELLHATKLSRKTLSARLKELCKNGAIVKINGLYQSDGSSNEVRGRSIMRTSQGFSRAFRDRRLRTLVWMLMLVTSFSVSGYVLAMHFAPALQQVNTEPVIVGYSTAIVGIHDVNDLYAWQVAMVFNATELKVLQVTAGNFVGTDYPFSFNSTDTREGLLLLGGTLAGDMPGKGGSGVLATVVFGYYTSNYKAPMLAPTFETYLLDSQLQIISVGTKLSLSVVG